MIISDFFSLFSFKSITLKDRKFPNNFFVDKKIIENIQTKGFYVFEDVVETKEIEKLQTIYQKLTTFSEYSINNKFQNSGRFQSPEIRKFVMENIASFSEFFLPKVFDKYVFDKDTTGAFQIKPPSKVSELNPHQDAPVIDETVENALFVWIPLCDIDDKNGAIYVLPGSHLWGNHQRSLNVPWAFEKDIKYLWENMTPIYMKKGSVLVWDSALIHASSPNLSENTRVAITTTLLPQNYKMVEYFKDSKTPKDKVEKYQVEKSFWENEDIMQRPPCPPNKFLGIEDMVFKNRLFMKWHLKKLMSNNK